MNSSLAAIATMAILYIVNSVQAIGDLSATTLGGMDREPTMEELSGGIIANGLGSVIGTLFGGLPTATYSQNVGIVSNNKVINRSVFALAAAIMACAGFIPKFAAIFTSIPKCVRRRDSIGIRDYHDVRYASDRTEQAYSSYNQYRRPVRSARRRDLSGSGMSRSVPGQG